MKPITKVLFGIVAICGLLQSIGFGLLLWPNREFTRFYVQQAGWLRPVMRMRIEAFSGNVKELKQEAQRIEETARQKLQACLGVPVKHVRVHLLPATKVKAKTARVI